MASNIYETMLMALCNILSLSDTLTNQGLVSKTEYNSKMTEDRVQHGQHNNRVN